MFLCFWGSGLSQQPAKYAGEFLDIGVGARAQALGAAFSAVANDGTAIYWNPAGLGQIAYPHIALMHAERFAGEINYDFAGAVFPYRSQTTFGLGVIRMGIDGIPDTRNALIDSIQANGKIDEGERLNTDRVTYFSDTDYAVYFSFAHRNDQRTYLGANIKFIWRSIGQNTAWGMGFDIGVLHRRTENFAVGLTVTDVTSTLIAWDTGRKELISPRVKLGSVYYYKVRNLPLTVMPLIEADIRFEGRKFASQYHIGRTSLDMHYGAEMQYGNHASARIGYDYINRFTTGAGVQWSNISVDYAFTSFDDFGQLGNSHRVSLAFDIPSEKYSRN